MDGVEILAFEDSVQLESWLAEHHELQTGVWLKIAKKSSGLASVTSGEVIEVALCFGWIDGQRRSCDETHFFQKITPRRARSHWSKVNVQKIDALTEAGRMREPGLAEVRAARADGRWDAAYESQKNATVPPDLAAALEKNRAAREFFEQLDKTHSYAVILRLLKVRTPESRAAQLRKIIALLESGQRIR